MTGLELVNNHISKVQFNIASIITNLVNRATNHDSSKYSNEELPLIDNKAYLDTLEYNSTEYKAALENVSVAVEHHYEHNTHHPEHYANGIYDMTLFDMLEMLADWKASSKDIYASLESNRERFHISDELYNILLNTIKELNW